MTPNHTLIEPRLLEFPSPCTGRGQGRGHSES
jgi:hypothetical protein